MRRALLALAAASLLLVSPAHAWLRHLAAGGAGGSAPQTIASVTPSTASFTQGTTSGTTIATLVATMSPSSPGPTGSFALSTLADICNGTNGANNNLVQVSGSSLQVSTTGSSQTTGTYAVCVAYTQAGISNSPKAVAITLTISAGTTLALTRNFNQPTGTSTPASAFWMIGQPFHKTTDLPSGNSLTATLGGTSVRMGACQRKQEIDGSVGWSQIMVDYSGQTITPGSSKSLVFTSATGSWTDTNPNSDASLQAQWTGLNDTATIASVSTTSTGGSDMNAGPYTATFNSSAQITVMCTNPLGREYQVVAPFINGSSVTHRFLQAVMYYWVTTNSGSGSFGPVASMGPIVENEQVFKTNPGSFTYDLTFARNGVTQRSYPGVVNIAFTGMWAGRPDGQWDWTADDPAVWVSQDYTQVDATLKSPPYIHGISYVGGNLGNAISQAVTAESAGTFTVASIQGLMQQADSGSFQSPTSIEFDGSLGGLSGLTLGKVYWFRYGSPTTFAIYDTQAHAWAGGATGQVIPTGTYSSGMTAELDAAPNSPGLYSTDMQGTGPRPDIGLQPEWFVAYLIGNTQAWQRMGRVQAISYDSIPLFAINDATGTIPSLLDSTGTPTTQPNMAGGTGLGTAKTTSYWVNFAFYSGDIGGGSGPTGTGGGGTLLTDPAGLWGASGSREHTPGSGYLVWLLEGNPYLQRIEVGLGNQGMAQQLATSRNYSCSYVNSGATYYGVSATINLFDRQMAWSELDAGKAAFVAPPGSAEEKYFQNQLNNEGAWEEAYQTYKGANFTALGATGIDEDGVCSTTLQGPYGSNFQAAYTNLGFGFSAMLEGDFASSYKTVTDRTFGIFNYELNDNILFFSDNYNPGLALSDGGAASPGSYIASAADMGVGEEWSFSFSGTTVTVSNDGAGSGWGTIYSSIAPPFAQGDKYRCFQYNSDGQGPTAACPSPLTPGTDYFVCSPSGATFSLSTSSGCGTLLSFSAASNIGGIMLPTGQSAPPAADGTIHSTIANPDSYLQWIKAAACLQALRGVSGASAACTAAATVTTATYSTEAMWAMQATP